MGIELSSHVNFQGICIGADHVSENDILVFILKKKKKKKKKRKEEKKKRSGAGGKMECFLSSSPPAVFFPVLSICVILTF